MYITFLILSINIMYICICEYIYIRYVNILYIFIIYLIINVGYSNLRYPILERLTILLNASPMAMAPWSPI